MPVSNECRRLLESLISQYSQPSDPADSEYQQISLLLNKLLADIKNNLGNHSDESLIADIT